MPLEGTAKLQYMKEYYVKNREKLLQKNRRYYQNTKEERREYAREYRVKHPEYLTKRRETNMELRRTLYIILNGARCVRCGFSNELALQFDHKNGRGYRHKKKKFRDSQTMFIKYYVKHPKEARQTLQVLCANCNWIKKGQMQETPPRKKVLS